MASGSVIQSFHVSANGPANDRSTAWFNKRSLRGRSPMYSSEVTMEHYVHRENIAHYQRLLAETNVTKDQARHAVLLELLAAEIAKDKIRVPKN
jgi:hypothetical protein